MNFTAVCWLISGSIAVAWGLDDDHSLLIGLGVFCLGIAYLYGQEGTR